MAGSAELSANARLCRWAASIRTTGGARADRVLLALAERLQREAAALEEVNGECERRASPGPSETDW